MMISPYKLKILKQGVNPKRIIELDIMSLVSLASRVSLTNNSGFFSTEALLRGLVLIVGNLFNFYK